MMKKYAGLMAGGRQNTFWFLWQDYFAFGKEGAVVEFRRDRLKRYIRTFLDAGFQTIHGAPFVRRRKRLAIAVEDCCRAAIGIDTIITSSPS